MSVDVNNGIEIDGVVSVIELLYESVHCQVTHHICHLRVTAAHVRHLVTVNYSDFNVRQYTAHVIDIAGRLSVCPSHAGIVSKRLNLSSNCLHCLVAP